MRRGEGDREGQTGSVDISQPDLRIQQMVDRDLRLDEQSDERHAPVRATPAPEEPQANGQPDHVGAERGEAAPERWRA